MKKKECYPWFSLNLSMIFILLINVFREQSDVFLYINLFGLLVNLSATVVLIREYKKDKKNNHC